VEVISDGNVRQPGRTVLRRNAKKEVEMKKLLFLALIVFFVFASAAAQDQPPRKSQRFPLEISFINQAVSDPFGKTILEILHPGFTLGTELAWKDGRHGRLFQGFQAGYYNNKYNSRAVFLQSGLGYRYTLGFGFFGEAAAVFGYLRYYHPTEIFRLNAQGEYELATDKGKGALMISAALGLGYDFSRKVGWPVSVFVRYQPYIHAPDTPDEGVLWQAMLCVGLRIQLW
jgi:hypothetical protein